VLPGEVRVLLGLGRRPLLRVVAVQLEVAQLGVGDQAAVDEQGAADARAEGQQDDGALAAAAGAEGHLGHARRVRVVQDRDGQPAEALAEQRGGVLVDPALVHVGRGAGDAAGDDAGEGDADRAGPAEVTDDLRDAVGHGVRGRRLRCQHFVALLRQIAAIQIHGSALDPGSADVHSEDVHGHNVKGRS
jgi:hypothetical protein